MATIVIMPGGFHPFHAGHYALYKSAVDAFPDADVYVAATNDTSARPFPFAIKEKLAKLAGVAPNRFVQVKSPFKSEEVTAQYNPEQDTLIFVRSDKDRGSPPRPGGVKKDGSPSYLQPWTGKNVEPFARHAYMAYLPTVEFGPGMTSATEIRAAWPQLNEKRKTALVMSLYPRTQGNAKLAATVVGLLDAAIGGEQGVAEGLDEAVGDNYLYHATQPSGMMRILRGGAIKASYRPQEATKARTQSPTVSTTRSKQYAESDDFVNFLNLTKEGNSVIIVFDRNAVANHYKMFSTSQGTQTVGDEFEEVIVVPKGMMPIQGTMKGFYFNPTRTSEIEEFKDTPWFKELLNSPYYMGQKQGVAEGSLEEFAPGGNSASSYYAVTANFVNDFAQQKQEELQDLIDAGWTKQDLAQAGTLQSQAADIVHFEQVRDGFLKGLKPGFDAYLQGDTQLKDQLGSYWQENDLPLNQDWEKIYGEPWGRDEYDEGVAENIKVEPVAKSLRIQNTQTQPKQNVYVAPDKKKTPAVVNHIKTKDQPTNEDYIDEKWSDKYKQSINCDRPRGFSQRAHCAGRKK